jgi:gamma-glutamylcyclotransferase (GGCT)/AIG2-like uncharacterized protein YtfP
MLLNTVLRTLNSSRRLATTASTWAKLVDRLAHAVFRASDHLIVYGSLSPGGPNHGRLAAINGMWSPGWVEGELEEVGWGAQLGFPALCWRPGAPRVAAHLLRSTALRDHWAELDRFEGAAYQRILARSTWSRGRERSVISTRQLRRLSPNKRMQLAVASGVRNVG